MTASEFTLGTQITKLQSISSIRRFGYYFVAACFVQLLHVLKGGYYLRVAFIGKPTDINDGWIRYVRAIQ